MITGRLCSFAREATYIAFLMDGVKDEIATRSTLRITVWMASSAIGLVFKSMSTFLCSGTVGLRYMSDKGGARKKVSNPIDPAEPALIYRIFMNYHEKKSFFVAMPKMRLQKDNLVIVEFAPLIPYVVCYRSEEHTS